MARYDLVVLASGPAGQKAAIAAAMLGRRVAIVDRSGDVGGSSIHAGTIPSKTLREVVSYLSGVRPRHIYGAAHRVKERTAIHDLGDAGFNHPTLAGAYKVAALGGMNRG